MKVETNYSTLPSGICVAGSSFQPGLVMERELGVTVAVDKSQLDVPEPTLAVPGFYLPDGTLVEYGVGVDSLLQQIGDEIMFESVNYDQIEFIDIGSHHTSFRIHHSLALGNFVSFHFRRNLSKLEGLTAKEAYSLFTNNIGEDSHEFALWLEEHPEITLVCGLTPYLGRWPVKNGYNKHIYSTSTDDIRLFDDNFSSPIERGISQLRRISLFWMFNPDYVSQFKIVQDNPDITMSLLLPNS